MREESTTERTEREFNDNVVVVTGGATGIGKAMADRFGAEGAKVILSARREDRLQQAVEDLVGSYAASKYAARAISETLRLEVPDHIQLGNVYPGLVQSEFGGTSETTSTKPPKSSPRPSTETPPASKATTSSTPSGRRHSNSSAEK